jgi:hypothetical protein
MFAYLTRRLGYAESDAIRRVRAAKAVRAYPSILRLLSSGDLNVVGVAMLEPLLTPQNHQGLLRKAMRRSTREIERLVAEMSPAVAGPRDRIRALPAPPTAPAEIAPMPEATETAPGIAELQPEMIPALQSFPSAQDETNGTKTRVVFTFSAGEEVRGMFEQARDLLRHRFPAGAMEDVIGEALRRLVESERPGFARPRKRKIANDDGIHRRRIPRWVEDEVWRRDGGRCAFVGTGGVRCGETAWLELDHAVPFALGGPSDHPDNVRLLCRAHNQSEARTTLGEKRSPAART